MALRRANSSSSPGKTICTILLGSCTIFLVVWSCHWPAALNTVRPAGKRGVISRSTKLVQSASLTAMRLPILRPNIISATCVGFWPLRQSTNCARASSASAKPSIRIGTRAKTRIIRRPRYGTDTGPLSVSRSFQLCAGVPSSLRLPAT
jgi:hypothetical protein